MKYIFTFIIVAILFSFQANSQSFQLYERNGALIPHDDTLDVWGNTSSYELEIFIDVKNTDSVNHPTRVQKFDLDMASVTQSYFCWGVCYVPEVFVSPSPLEIKAGETVTEFSGHLMHFNQTGTSTVRYCFFDEADTLDRTCVNVNYHLMPTGMANPEEDHNRISAFPNPADHTVTFNYLLSKAATQAKIYIYNLLGASIEEIILPAGYSNVTFETSLMNSGVYFYAFEVDGKVLNTQRLVVVH